MWSLWETELSGSSTARESKGSRDGLGPKIGPGISNTPAPFFTQGPHTGIFFPLEAPIIRQIIIILRKTTNFDRPTGLKMNQPIWHLPELPCGQSTPKGSMQLLLLLHPETYHQAPSPTPSSTLMYKLNQSIHNDDVSYRLLVVSDWLRKSNYSTEQIFIWYWLPHSIWLHFSFGVKRC